MKNAAVFYHKADLDGVMSGVIAKYYLSPRREVVDLIPIDYGDDFIKALPKDEKEYDEIYVIDVSDRKLFEKLGHKITWIDHHKVIEDKEFPPVKDRHCMIGVAACRLALRYFTDINYHFDTPEYYKNRVNPNEPWVVTLAGEYDIWDKSSLLAERFNFGVIDISFERVELLFKQTKAIYAPTDKYKDSKFLKDNKNTSSPEKDFAWIEHLINKGEGALEYIRSTDKRVAGVPVTICFNNDNNGVSTARGVSYNTHIKTSLIHDLKDDEQFTMVWNYHGGDKVKVSFYSDKIDVSNIANRFGGGGHKGAAGCSIDIPEFVKILSDSNK